jgi:ABC-type Mn2+/Zn2+ transport system permease subunit
MSGELSYLEAVLASPLLQRAVIAGALCGLCCACLSPLVVLRRMAFIGDGIAHAAFGGIGLALFLLATARYDDPAVQAITLLFSVVLGVGIGIATRRGGSAKLAEDSAIGVAFSVSMALGALLIALRQRHTPKFVPSMDAYLFGSLINIGPADVWLLAGVAVAVVALLVLLQKEILYYAFDARLAEASGLNMGLVHYLFIMLLVLTVAVSARVVGIVLVSASLVIPGVIALKLCRRLAVSMLLAAVVGVASFELGMYVSYQQNVLPGAAIILIQFALLLLVYGYRALRADRAGE